MRPSRCNICTGPRSSPSAPKHSNNSNQEMGWEMSRLPTPVWEELCIIHLACKKPTNPAPPTQTETRQTRTNLYQSSERRRQKKKAGAGLDLGELAEHGVRIEDVERVREEENTRGNPNPKRGLVFPSACERERQRKKRRRRTSQQKKKKERTTNTKANRGLVLKGTKPNNITTPKTMKPTQKKHTNTQGTPNKQNKHQAYRVSGELSQQGGGAHGPPCTFLRGGQTCNN